MYIVYSSDPMFWFCVTQPPNTFNFPHVCSLLMLPTFFDLIDIVPICHFVLLVRSQFFLESKSCACFFLVAYSLRLHSDQFWVNVGKCSSTALLRRIMEDSGLIWHSPVLLIWYLPRKGKSRQLYLLVISHNYGILWTVTMSKRPIYLNYKWSCSSIFGMLNCQRLRLNCL